ncbi:uncharacterized protein I206_101943 [Kwoniella pini CBS 10737]|uniref:Uncharacterized protein n=1 Tax=Kwoniella pini CBS 10737 TaxID=1296096 RepID=A0A1B9HVA3_9TREE|nr:uncharacterized protein I206_06966 [Kwoniella pini CBS 10737]OCF47188.1 hypothetical protein I206_06966 [Kwoniella pini CBS 10737]
MAKNASDPNIYNFDPTLHSSKEPMSSIGEFGNGRITEFEQPLSRFSDSSTDSSTQLGETEYDGVDIAGPEDHNEHITNSMSFGDNHFISSNLNSIEGCEPPSDEPIPTSYCDTSSYDYSPPPATHRENRSNSLPYGWQNPGSIYTDPDTYGPDYWRTSIPQPIIKYAQMNHSGGPSIASTESETSIKQGSHNTQRPYTASKTHFSPRAFANKIFGLSKSSSPSPDTSDRSTAASTKTQGRRKRAKELFKKFKGRLSFTPGNTGLTHISNAERDLYGCSESEKNKRQARFDRSLDAEGMLRTSNAPSYGLSLGDISIKSGGMSEEGSIFEGITYEDISLEGEEQSQKFTWEELKDRLGERESSLYAF